MAGIFLSYARADSARAKRIAAALERAGHSVWWDRQLSAGSRFTAEIDRALKAADAVVVLWSRASIESAWVQDEAAAGRDSGRLIPVLLEKVEPPLGFRQYQAIDLAAKRLTATSLDPLIAAVGQGSSVTRAPRKADRSTSSALRPITLASAALALLVIVALGLWWLTNVRRAPNEPSIVIAASSQAASPAAASVASAIATDLGRFQAGPLGVLQIVQADSRARASYRAAITMAEDQRQMTLGLALDSDSGTHLWSTTLAGPRSDQPDFVRQAAAKLGAALACDLAIRARRGALAADVRHLYLDGCSRIAELRSAPDEQAIDALRQVTQKAPNFAGGWAQLSLAEFLSLQSTPPNEVSTVAHSAGRHAETASKLDPSAPEPYFVRAFDVRDRPGTMASALREIDRGLQSNPDSALLNDARATVLGNVGRLQEALESARRATTLNPLSTGVLRNYVVLLAYNGQLAAARGALKEAEADWPRSTTVADTRFEFEMRYGDAAKALQMVQNGLVEQPGEGALLYIRARLQPTAANVDALLQYFRPRFAKDPSDIFGYLQALGTFNRVDEAYRMLSNQQSIEGLYHNGEALFRPFIKSIRADPRFIGLAYRTGMLTFWRQSNDWPDFCADPQLPYDCRKEAAKYPLDLPQQP